MPQPAAATFAAGERRPFAHRVHQPRYQRVTLDRRPVRGDADVGQNAIGGLGEKEEEERDVTEKTPPIGQPRSHPEHVVSARH